MTRFCTWSWCCNGMRLWGILGGGECILHMGGIWINGSQKVDHGPILQGSPQWFFPLVFIPLCSFLQHWIGLTKLGHKRRWGLHFAFCWIICSGEASCHVMRTLKQPYGEIQMTRVRCFLPIASMNLPAIWISFLRNESFRPSHTFRLLQPQLTWLQPCERFNARST